MDNQSAVSTAGLLGGIGIYLILINSLLIISVIGISIRSLHKSGGYIRWAWIMEVITALYLGFLQLSALTDELSIVNVPKETVELFKIAILLFLLLIVNKLSKLF